MNRGIWIALGVLVLVMAAGAGWWAGSGFGRAADTTEARLYRGKAPASVIAHDPASPKSAKLPPTGGVLTLLYDKQIDASKPTRTDYVRIVRQPVSSVGVSTAARMTYVFEPSFQRLVLNHVFVTRAGKREDRTSAATVQFARPEEGMNDNMIDGVVNAQLQVPDVLEGDVVDIAATVEGAYSAFQGREATTMYARRASNVERLTLRAIWPDSATWRTEDDLTGLKARKENGAVTLDYGPAAVLGYDTDQDSEVDDGDAVLYPAFSVSSFASWPEVVAWAQPLYKPQPDDQVRAIARRIKSETPAQADQMLAALRFVQKDVRYVAIMLGAAGHVPQSPAETLRLRYGDCKGKTLLLVSLLTELGIPAEAALTDLDDGADLRDELPSPLAFDHVVARVTIGGRTLWLDATQSPQGGDIAHIASVDYGLALPIGRVTGGLVSMQDAGPPIDVLETTETFDLSAGAAEPARLESRITVRGEMADMSRDLLVTRSGVKNMLSVWTRDRYDEAKPTGDFHIEDRFKTNEIDVAGAFHLPGASHRDGDRDMLPITADGILAVIDDDARDDIPATIKQQHTRHTILFKLPPQAQWTPPQETHRIENQAFVFTRTTEQVEGGYRMVFDLMPLAHTLAAVDVAGALDDQDAMDALLSFEAWLEDVAEQSPPPDAAEAPLPAPHASSRSAISTPPRSSP